MQQRGVLKAQPEMTTLSFSSQTPAPPDAERRRDNRHLSVLRVAKLCARGREELCLIRNISSGGMMAHVYSHLAEGDAVTVELKNGQGMEGEIVWAREGSVGIQFREGIDVFQALAGDDRHMVPGYLPRSPRIAVHVPACICRDGRHHPVTVCDISLGGIKVDFAEGLNPGDHVTVSVTGLAQLAGTVKWRRERMAGIAFTPAVPFDTLSHWAAEHVDASH